MAGHSKWNNIKNRKSALDAKKSQVFGNLSKLIRMAVKEGGSGEAQFNPSLRTLLEKAREVNMPKEKIERAIEKGLGKSKLGAKVAELLYEAFGPVGEAYLIPLVTDNPQRSSAEMKAILARKGGALAGPGAAQYLFKRVEGGFRPLTPLVLTPEQQVQVKALVDALREHEDVEEVFSTAQLEAEEGSAEL